MIILSHVVTYLFIGVFIAAGIEVYTAVTKNEKIKAAGKEIGKNELMWMIVIWPLGVYHFIKGFIRGLKIGKK